MSFSPRQVHHRIKTDPHFLKVAVCDAFRKYDKYSRGLLSAASFSRALEDLGLKFGSPEVDEVMRSCTVTDDGYVHYKDLLAAIQPKKPAAAQTSVGDAIAPRHGDTQQQQENRWGEEEEESFPQVDLSHPGALRELVSSKTGELRRLYAMWDRAALKDSQFQTAIRKLGIPLSADFMRLMEVNGPSRTLPFATLVQALQVDDSTARRTRSSYASISEDQRLPPRTTGRRASLRDPIAWRGEPGVNAQGLVPSGVSGRASPTPSSRQPASARGDQQQQQVPSSGSGGSLDALLQKTVSGYVDGVTPQVVFKAELRRLGVKMSMDLESLMRRHEANNSAKFADFMRAIYREQPELLALVKRQHEAERAEEEAPQEEESPASKGGVRQVRESPTLQISKRTPYAWPAEPSPRAEQKEEELRQKQQAAMAARQQQIDEGKKATPYATLDDEPEDVPVPVRYCPMKPDHGDIIGWNGVDPRLVKDQDPLGIQSKRQTGVGKGYGDIIGWSGEPRGAMLRPPSRGSPSQQRAVAGEEGYPEEAAPRSNGDIIGWRREAEGGHVPGKKLYNAYQRADCPFGTDADVRPGEPLNRMPVLRPATGTAGRAAGGGPSSRQTRF